ncbi:hypothetical protein D3C84_1023840 [compost metagenome]
MLQDVSSTTPKTSIGDAESSNALEIRKSKRILDAPVNVTVFGVYACNNAKRCAGVVVTSNATISGGVPSAVNPIN